MEQRLDVMDGIGVQILGDRNSVRISHGAAELTLVRRHRRVRTPTRDLHLLDPSFQAVPLIGRDRELADLRAWLDDPRQIAVRCLTGGPAAASRASR